MNQWFYNIFQFSVGTLLLLSGTTQGLRRHAHTVRLLLTHGELASLILFPTELGPDNCQENKHELLEIKAFSYVFESVFERRFKKVSVRPSTCYETQVLNVDLLHAASTSRASSSRHKWSALPASLLQNVRVLWCKIKQTSNENHGNTVFANQSKLTRNFEDKLLSPLTIQPSETFQTLSSMKPPFEFRHAPRPTYTYFLQTKDTSAQECMCITEDILNCCVISSYF